MNIIFAGTPEFACPSLQALLDSSHKVVAVLTQPDRPAGRGQQLQASPVKQLAQKYDLPVHQPTTLRDASVQKMLAAYQADVMVVAAYGLLLPTAILEMPKHGCINVHASLLPRWRGAAPIQRAILAGDQKTGVTIMQMNIGLDTGDMLAKRECIIDSHITAAMLHDQLAQLGAHALLPVLDTLAAGNAVPGEPQDESSACYATKLTKAEAIIDWQQSTVAIDRCIRAFNPWPVAQSQLAKMTVRIWSAHIATTQITHASPGTIVQADRNGLQVATGDGVICIDTVQLPGKRSLPVADVLNAHADQFAVGKRFN